jgi:hypothetical protein
MITAQHAFNPIEKLYVHHDGCVMSIDDITALNNSRDESEAVFQLQGKLQKLCLNDEENSILTALCIMSAGWLSE